MIPDLRLAKACHPIEGDVKSREGATGSHEAGSQNIFDRFRALLVPFMSMGATAIRRNLVPMAVRLVHGKWNRSREAERKPTLSLVA
jgi:hypothetical protein